MSAALNYLPNASDFVPATFLERLKAAQESDKQGTEARPDRIGAPEIDLALKTIYAGSAKLKEANERVEQVEARSGALLREAKAKLAASEDRIQGLQARLTEAETRAEEAETWLRTLIAALGNGETPPAASQAPDAE